MANVSQLIRRQSSRELSAQKSIDRLELELEARLVPTTEEVPDYGATNHAFDPSPAADIPAKVRYETEHCLASFKVLGYTLFRF